MAHGLNAMLKRGANALACKSDGKTGIGSRRIFAPQFKLQVLDSYRNDADCKGNQRATARKYGIHRRQIQKWLQVENNLRNSVIKSKCSGGGGDLIVSSPEARKCGLDMALRSAEHRQRDDVLCVEATATAYNTSPRQQRRGETPGDTLTEGRGCARLEDTTARDAPDNRVPDIPQQHSPVATVALYATPTTSTTTSPTLTPNHIHTTIANNTLSTSHHHNIPAAYEHYNNNHEWQPVLYPLRHGSPDDSSSTRSSPSHCSLSPRSPPCHPASYIHAATVVPTYQSHHSIPIAPVASPVSTNASSSRCPTPFYSADVSPLDFTMHSRRRVAPSDPGSPRGATTTSPLARYSPAPTPAPLFAEQHLVSDSAAPMDLSLKKSYPRASPDLHAPVPVVVTKTAPPRLTLDAPQCPTTTTALSSLTSVNTTVLEREPQIWDLSTKGIKRQRDNDDIITISTSSNTAAVSESVTTSATGNTRPIKLFKPYLDHVIEECPNNNTVTTDTKPIIVSTIEASNILYPENHFYHNNNNNNNNHNNNNNNNNNNMDYKPEYNTSSTLLYKDENYHGNFYGPGGEYFPNGGLHFLENRLHFDDSRYFNSKQTNSIKQRQSYSLDFKLSAIECYYSDAVCRGNQRAVASKFKIHRRQVQKWLKQEDQLRQRNETKPMHIVR